MTTNKISAHSFELFYYNLTGIIGLRAVKNYEKSFQSCMGKDNNPSLSLWIYNLATIKSCFSFYSSQLWLQDDGQWFILCVTKVNIKQKKESHDELFIFYNIKNELNI